MQGETIFILLFVVAAAVAIAVQRRAAEGALIVTARVRKPEAWRGFMMRFELGLDEPNPQRAVRSAWLPANLIQAQRDYFGAHTYERIDAKGTFHTEWEKE